ncbi:MULTISPECIES: DUF4174 domain-containing protein [unclassified Paracoccus (in: a-proteobacteria)]|uniref:DUF4174 domain-containing protein n=1 Tax=unclassified Paracoccus (in: a-proteobacteria) TaxID=2688777 RepID=UPI001F25DA43|nr:MULTISPECIES: DUF4174 domain-containing protein [unclassified Paracoccus (in: a-proteobacteria)]
MKIFLSNMLALALAVTGAQALAMGAPTPPPEPVRVERAAPARPAAAAGATDAPVGQPEQAEMDIRSANDVTPEALLFERRPVLVFADTPEDTAFATQMELLARDPAALERRSVTVITDTDPAANSVWRQRLRPRGFSLMVLDSDGTVIDRKPSPWDTREIGRAIDKTPVRRSETRASGGR